MIQSIHFSAQQYDPSAAQPSHAASARKNQNAEELTTVTTHCDQNRWHTPSSPPQRIAKNTKLALAYCVNFMYSINREDFCLFPIAFGT